MEGPKLLKATRYKLKMKNKKFKDKIYNSHRAGFTPLENRSNSRFLNTNPLPFFLKNTLSLPKTRSLTGFTLIEVMIALVIVSVAVIAVFNLVNYHADVAYEHTIKTRMLLMAREKISEMEANLKNSKGAIPGTVFIFENLVNNTKDKEIIELKTIISGDNKKVVLRELVLRKQTQEPK
jgi:prepilin-type N-terminal cleavage/methylation domain-containing protein